MLLERSKFSTRPLIESKWPLVVPEGLLEAVPPLLVPDVSLPLIEDEPLRELSMELPVPPSEPLLESLLDPPMRELPVSLLPVLLVCPCAWLATNTIPAAARPRPHAVFFMRSPSAWT